MEPRKDDTELAEALRSLRPAPRPEFTAELDARVAAAFPRPGRRRSPSTVGGLVDRLWVVPPRRLLAPAGASAVAAIVVATAVISISDTTPVDVPSSDTVSVDPSRLDAARSGAARETGRGSQGAERTIERGSAPSVEYAGSPEMLSKQPPRRLRADSAASATALSAPGVADRSGPYASRTRRREIERSAQIVLGADPDQVRSAAAEVYDAVHAADGIVLRSSVRDGAAGEAGAEFELLVSSGKLGDALAAFSAIAEVRSRREATQDITAPTVSARERLQDSQARIESLLGQLAEAETEGERVAVEADLRGERRHAAFLRSRLSNLERRANFSRVSLHIETGAPSSDEDEGGAWGIGDGLDSAGRVLAVAAGVTVIAVALLAPLAVIALLAWLARRTWLRRRREQALT